MKQKLVDTGRLYSTVILFLVFGAIVHFLFGFQPDESAKAQSPWMVHLMLYSLGISLLIVGVLSETTTLIGVEFFEENENSVRFAHYRNVIRFKFTAFLLAIALLLTGLYLNPKAFSGPELTNFQDIRLAAGLLASGLLMAQIIRSYRRLIHNREDYLEIGSGFVRWYDNDDGAVKSLDSAEVGSIGFIFESEAESPDLVAVKVKTRNAQFRIEFRRMSLLSHGKMIRKAFERFFSDKIEKQ